MQVYIGIIPRHYAFDICDVRGRVTLEWFGSQDIFQNSESSEKFVVQYDVSSSQNTQSHSINKLVLNLKYLVLNKVKILFFNFSAWMKEMVKCLQQVSWKIFQNGI